MVLCNFALRLILIRILNLKFVGNIVGTSSDPTKGKDKMKEVVKEKTKKNYEEKKSWGNIRRNNLGETYNSEA